MFSCRQNEKFEELGEVIGELRDHQPCPVGDEAPAGQMAGADAVLELLDVVLGASSGKMMFENAAACSPSVGDHRGVEKLSDDSLGAFVEGRSLDDHPECRRPTMRPVRELRPFGIFLPGIRAPSVSRKVLDGVAKGRSELCRDRELQSFFEETLHNLPAVEPGIKANADETITGQAGETLGDKAGRFMRSVLVSGAKSHADEKSRLRPEAQKRMQPLDPRIPVAGSLLEIAEDLNDGAVEIKGDGLLSTYVLGTPEKGMSYHALNLLDMTGGELAQELPRSGGSGNLKIVKVAPGGSLASQDFKVGEVRSADEEVIHEAHDEIRRGDASPPLLHRQLPETRDNAQLPAQVGNELQPRERGYFVIGRNVLNGSDSVCYLHLTSAPFWFTGFCFHPYFYQK